MGSVYLQVVCIYLRGNRGIYVPVDYYLYLLLDVSHGCLSVHYNNWPIPARDGNLGTAATTNLKNKLVAYYILTYVLLPEQLHGKQLLLPLQTDCSFYLTKWNQ